MKAFQVAAFAALMGTIAPATARTHVQAMPSLSCDVRCNMDQPIARQGFRSYHHRKSIRKAVGAFNRASRYIPLPAPRPRDLGKAVAGLDSLISGFKAPIGAICGANLLKAYHRAIAKIIEPVRPGYVAIGTASGRRAIVAHRVANQFVGFIRELEATGYRIQEIGGYAYRRIAGSRRMSKHASGLAVDINQDARDIVTIPMNRRAVSKLADRWGLCSGGDWRNPDLGHFEVCGRPRVALAETEMAKPIVMASLEPMPIKESKIETGIASTFYDRTIACPPYRINPYKVEGIAHKSLPCGTIVEVVNKANGLKWTGAVIDLGPCTSKDCQSGKTAAYKRARKRSFDLLPRVARKLRSDGLARVTVAVIR